MVKSVPLNIAQLEEWIGNTETGTDLVSPTPLAALSATLDRGDPAPRPGDPLPPVWHWLFLLPLHRQSELAKDGHARLGGFLPPVPLPRRMWAGNRMEFHQPLRVGETITRTSRIASVKQRQGRTGPLVFVLVRHEIANAAGLAITEEHDIAYRDHAHPGESAPEPPPAPTGAAWERTIWPDDVLLFRYSALTFNGHRIHYDRRYATEVEGYPGLVVHGPLIATLLLDALRRNMPAAQVARVEFRAVSPLFDTAPFCVCGAQQDKHTVRMWARNANGGLAMEARVAIRGNADEGVS
jgi:3-methylfumaryl-CoA hydratase